jgi:hypothetical protein
VLIVGKVDQPALQRRNDVFDNLHLFVGSSMLYQNLDGGHFTSLPISNREMHSPKPGLQGSR